mgnify:CR=1 FL=1
MVFRNFLNDVSKYYYIIIHYGFNVEIAEAPFINYNLLPFSRCLNTKALPFTTVRFLESSFFQELDIKNVNSNETSVSPFDVNNIEKINISKLKFKYFNFINTILSEYRMDWQGEGICLTTLTK